ARDIETYAMAAANGTEGAAPFAYPLNLAYVPGLRTAELHAALASPTEDEAFTVLPVRKADFRAWSRSVARDVRGMVATLRKLLETAPEDVADDIRAVLAARDALLAGIKAVETLRPSGGQSRIHG